MINYHCTIDALDYLEVDNLNEGIRFMIKMYNNKDDSFDMPAVVLTEIEVKRLIIELKEILNRR